jgi:hypothetical protein
MGTVAQPKVRPFERFWPYADLAENLSLEEAAVPDGRELWMPRVSFFINP